MTHVSVIRNALVAGLALASLPTFGGKKYIAFGWEFDKIGPEDLLCKVAEYDASPLDGVGVFYTMTDESGRPCGARTIMESGPWTQASAEANVPVLRELAVCTVAADRADDVEDALELVNYRSAKKLRCNGLRRESTMVGGVNCVTFKTTVIARPGIAVIVQ